MTEITSTFLECPACGRLLEHQHPVGEKPGAIECDCDDAARMTKIPPEAFAEREAAAVEVLEQAIATEPAFVDPPTDADFAVPDEPE